MSDPDHIEIAGAAPVTAPFTTGRLISVGRGRCAGSLRHAFGADENDAVIFGIQRGGFATLLGLHSLSRCEARGAVFLDDAQRAVALRTPGFHGVRVETSAVGAVTDGDSRQHFSVIRVHDDAYIRPRAHGKENMVLGIQAQSAGFAGAVTEVIFRDDLHGFDIDDRDLLLVLDIHIQLSLAVALGLLHGAADVNRSDHRAVLWINHCNARALMAEDINALCERFQHDAIRTALDLNAFDLLHRFRIEHPDLRAAAESVM